MKEETPIAISPFYIVTPEDIKEKERRKSLRTEIKKFIDEDKDYINKIFDVTCWKCWGDLTKLDFKNVKYPFKKETSEIRMKGLGVWNAFLLSNSIKHVTISGRFVSDRGFILYICPNCGYDKWRVTSVYYPYLYLWIRDMLLTNDEIEELECLIEDNNERIESQMSFLKWKYSLPHGTIYSPAKIEEIMKKLNKDLL